MSFTLPLDKLTVEEKLRLMEEIWADLSRNPDSIPVPEWHLEVLREREQLVKEGRAEYLDSETFKKQVAETVALDTALRKRFHGEIDRMSPSRLAVLQRVLLQLQLLEATDRLDRDFDRDRQDGKLSPELIEQAVREARATHPYS